MLEDIALYFSVGLNIVLIFAVIGLNDTIDDMG